MTRIGLLSDTHIPVDAKVLPQQILEVFRGVDLIMHAGDVYLPSVLDELERIAPVLVAAGDDDVDITDDRRVKEKHTLFIDGVSVSLSHLEPGIGPWSVFPYSNEDPSYEEYRYNDVSGICVYGHTHMPKVQNRGGYIMINPGSPTFPFYVHRPGTVVILEVGHGEATVQLVQLQ